MSALKKILVPTDFSEASAAALKYACDLADSTGASLDILHTVDKPYPLGGYPEYYSLPQDYFEGIERDARKNLEGVLTPEEKKRYRATVVLRSGVAAQEILLYLQEHEDIGLVVMATHGRGGVARLMIGSVADKIVRAARCPVLTMRVSEAEKDRTSHAA